MTYSKSKSPKLAESSSLSSAIKQITRATIRRTEILSQHVTSSSFEISALLPKASASLPATQSLNSTLNSTDPAVVADVKTLLNLFDWRKRSNTANSIRVRTDRAQRFSNLSTAMSAVGASKKC